MTCNNYQDHRLCNCSSLFGFESDSEKSLVVTLYNLNPSSDVTLVVLCINQHFCNCMCCSFCSLANGRRMDKVANLERLQCRTSKIVAHLRGLQTIVLGFRI